MRIFQRLTRTDGSRRPSSLVVLAAAPLMALGLAVGVTAPAQDAQVIDVSMESRAAESALTGCSGQSNRLLRFVGGSYVTKHDVCRACAGGRARWRDCPRRHPAGRGYSAGPVPRR